MTARPQKLAKRIERTVTGPMWHGPALAQVLDGVTHEMAARRPIAGAHSVWEIVLHVTTWAEIARLRLDGRSLGDPPPDQDWPPVGDTTPDAWRRAVERMATSHSELAAAARALTDDRLDARVHGLEYTVDTLLCGIIEHGTYHGGQIALLRKA